MSLSRQISLIAQNSREGSEPSKRKRNERPEIIQMEILNETSDNPIVPTQPQEIVPPEERIFGQHYDDLNTDTEIQEMPESTLFFQNFKICLHS